MISVAMCTYNGEKYIKKQLESILNQRRKVDQIVICDDLSDDGTIGIINAIQAETSDRIEVFINQSRLGVAGNFEKAVSLCRGEFIFLSDQDDVWRQDKVEKMMTVFENDDECDLIFTDANLIDGDGKDLGYSLWDSVGYDLTDAPTVRDFLGRRFVTGATVAARREVLVRALPIPESWIHDAWFAINAATQGKVTAFNEKLIQYRQHSTNVIGAKKHSLREQIEITMGNLNKSRDFRTTMKNRYLTFLERNSLMLSYDEQKEIKQCIAFWSDSEKIQSMGFCRSTGAIICNLFSGKYGRYNHGIYGALVDFAILLNRNSR